MPRLFVAAWPPLSVVEDLASVPRPDRPGIRWLPEWNWHVTLRFLGEAEPDEVTAALDATVLPRATALLGPAMRGLSGKMIIAPISGLEDLAHAVRVATAHIGQSPDKRPFTGHITLARVRDRSAASLPSVPIDGRFDVEEVLLIRSDLSPRGATYHPIARWATT